MPDEAVKTNIIESSVSYLMNIFSFVPWSEKNFNRFIKKELDLYLNKNVNYEDDELLSSFFIHLENKIIETISRKIEWPQDIDITKSLIAFIKDNSTYDSYTKLQKVSSIFTNRLRSNEHYLTFLKENNSILEIIKLNIDLNQKYEDILDQQKKNQINLIAKDKKARSFIEDYCIANDIDELNLFDNESSEIKNIVKSYNFSNVSSKSSNNKKLPTKEEQHALIRESQNGNSEAKTKLIECNIRLVISIARRYLNKGLSLEDLTQIGCIGMLTAIDKFDLTKYAHIKFSTYAYHWIRQAITRTVSDTADSIRIPIHMVGKINKVHSVSEELEKELGRPPTMQELAQEMDVPLEDINKIYLIPKITTSMDQAIGDDEKTFLGEIIEDKSALSPEDQAEKVDTREQMEYFLSKLKSRRTEAILRMRFGFETGEPMTLETVGQHFNLTRERIRQVEAKGLKELKKMMESELRRTEYGYHQPNTKKMPTNKRQANGTEKNITNINKKIEKEQKAMPKQKQNIYQILSEYSKEEINSVIDTLPEEDKTILLARYGGNLIEPIKNEDFSKEMYQRFYGNILPKIKRQLKNKNDSTNKYQPEKNNSVSESQNANISDPFIDIFRHPFFKEKTKQLPLVQIVIISLKLGYVHANNQPIETQTIANLLGMETEHVNDITKNILGEFKNELVNLLDNSAASIINDKQTNQTTDNKQLAIRLERPNQCNKPNE